MDLATALEGMQVQMAVPWGMIASVAIPIIMDKLGGDSSAEKLSNLQNWIAHERAGIANLASRNPIDVIFEFGKKGSNIRDLFNVLDFGTKRRFENLGKVLGGDQQQAGLAAQAMRGETAGELASVIGPLMEELLKRGGGGVVVQEISVGPRLAAEP